MTLGVSISIIYNDIVRTKTINGVKNLMLIITGFGILCLLISSDNLVEIYRFESEMLIIFAFVLILLGSLFYVRKPYKFEKVFIKYSMSIFLNHFMIAIILGYYLDNNESTYYKWIIPFVLFSIIASILISELVSKLRQALINRGKRKVNGTIST